MKPSYRLADSVLVGVCKFGNLPSELSQCIGKFAIVLGVLIDRTLIAPEYRSVVRRYFDFISVHRYFSSNQTINDNIIIDRSDLMLILFHLYKSQIKPVWVDGVLHFNTEIGTEEVNTVYD